MGVLSYIQEQKNKFQMKKAEIYQKRELAAEVRYEQQKEELSHQKVKLADLERRKQTEQELIHVKAKIEANKPKTGLQKLTESFEKALPRRIPIQEQSKAKPRRINIRTNYGNSQGNIFGGRGPF